MLNCLFTLVILTTDVKIFIYIASNLDKDVIFTMIALIFFFYIGYIGS